MKRMLINATQEEELRVALVDGQYLYNLFIENEDSQQKKANIYKGKVSRVEPSLGAAFVDYGSERHGFLPLKDIIHKSSNGKDEQPNIKDVIKPGQEIIIQIDKEERGNKGAAITNQISLAGSYMVLMPKNPEAGGISRRIDGEDRNDLRELLSKLVIPETMGVIIRTAGVGRAIEELQWDLDVLVKQWEAINDAYDTKAAPFLIYQESNVVTRAIRDYLRPEISEIVVDNVAIYEQTKDYISKVRPDSVDKVILYEDSTPLFSRFQIQKQIESAFQREVTLPSGGSLVFDINEALVSIDINSAKSTKGDDIESTAISTNLEAADEIGRQLRMRDLGGLVVIDFIDMSPIANQREVESRLRNAVQDDPARIQLGRISKFGLLEMSRQRLRPSLRESNQIICPRCFGQGTIRNVSSLSLAILRLIEEECMKEAGSQIQVHVPVAVATYLLNEKREQILGCEKSYNCIVLVLPKIQLETPHYSITRIRPTELTERQKQRLSYEIPAEQLPQKTQQRAKSNKAEIPAVKTMTPDKAAPKVRPQRKKSKPGFFAQLFASLFGTAKPEQKKQYHKNRHQSNRGGQGRKNYHQNRNRNNQNRRGNTNQQHRSSGNNPNRTTATQPKKDTGRSNKANNG